MEYLLPTKSGKKVTVRELQLEILEILDEVHRVCVKNNIRYMLMAGSALGIVNFKGFIPWDDDIDISVPREDYEKFIKALDKDLNKDKFYFHCFEKCDKYNVLIPNMKIRKKGTYIEEVNTLLPNRCEGDGVFIDVIVLDHASPNEKEDHRKRWSTRLWMPLLVFLDMLHINPKRLKKHISNKAKKYNEKYKDSKFLCETIEVPWTNPPIFPYDEVYPLKLYDFEGKKYYSYNKVKETCVRRYGIRCLGERDKDGNLINTENPKNMHSKHTKDINLKSDLPDK